MMKEIKRCKQLYEYTEHPVMAIVSMTGLLLLGLMFVFGTGTMYFFAPAYFYIAFNTVKQEFLKIGMSGLGASSPFYRTMALKLSNVWIVTVSFLVYMIVTALLFAFCKLRNNRSEYMKILWGEPKFSVMILVCAVVLAVGSVLIVISYKYFGVPLLMMVVLLIALSKNNIEQIPGKELTSLGAFFVGLLIVAAGCLTAVWVQKLLYRKPFSKYAFDRPVREE